MIENCRQQNTSISIRAISLLAPNDIAISIGIAPLQPIKTPAYVSLLDSSIVR